MDNKTDGQVKTDNTDCYGKNTAQVLDMFNLGAFADSLCDNHDIVRDDGDCIPWSQAQNSPGTKLCDSNDDCDEGLDCIFSAPGNTECSTIEAVAAQYQTQTYAVHRLCDELA